MKFKLLISAIIGLLSLSSCGTPPAATYTVTWQYEDGTIIERDEDVLEGTMPSYNGPIPYKSSDEFYSYTFSGWDPELRIVNSNQTYVATFEKTLVRSLIYFNLNGGTTYSSTSPRYIDSLDSSFFFFDVKKENVNFRGWSYEGKKVFDQKGNLLYSPTLQPSMTFTAIYAQDACLTIISNLAEAGTVHGEGYYAYNSYVDVFVEVNQGYSFNGWYYNDTILSTNKEYRYTMWNRDIYLVARFEYEKYEFIVESRQPEYGSVTLKGYSEQSTSITKIFSYKNSITISSFTKTNDHRFLGWFDENNTLVETNAVYTFTMPYNNYHLIAKWDCEAYQLTITPSYLNAGIFSGQGTYDYGEEVNISVIENEGYVFKNWTIEGKTYSFKDYSFYMPNHAVNIEADFTLIKYKIEYILDGGTNNSSNPSSYTIEDNLSLYNPTKIGYSFIGWYNGDDKVESIAKGMYGNLTLTAHWSINCYTVTIINNDSSKGTVSGAGSFEYHSQVTISATPNENYAFEGWYSENNLNIKLSSSNNYTFILNEENVIIYAKFWSKQEEMQWNINNGITPNIDVSKGTLTYGLYPQSVLGWEERSLFLTLDSLDSSYIDNKNGWYLYEGQYYTKCKASTYNNELYEFNDGV